MVRFIEVKGSHAELGERAGVALRQDIHAALDFLFHSKIISEVKPKWLPLGLLKFGLGLLAKHNIKKPIQQYLPRQFVKMQGMAKGAQIPMGIMCAIQFIETFTGNPKTSYVNPPVQACSQLIALPEATADKSLWIARNYDFPNILQPYQFVRQETPEDGGFKTLSMAQLSMVSTHMGVNEKGLAIALNYGRAWKKQPLDYRFKGVPSTMLVQEALETCETVEDVIKFITTFPIRAYGSHYGVVDKAGNACVIETTATRHSVRRPEGGILVHTNLYRTPELVDANVPDDVLWQFEGMQVPYTKSPRERYEREITLLAAARGKVTIETLKTILRDHNNGEPSDFTPCTHGHVGSTLASIIINPRAGEMWVTDNQPCKMEYQKFDLFS